MTRTATVNAAKVGWGSDPLAVVNQYLPSNYSAVLADNGKTILITGTDNAGWTLDGYVIPRLASGMIYATEVATTTPGPSNADAREIAQHGPWYRLASMSYGGSSYTYDDFYGYTIIVSRYQDDVFWGVELVSGSIGDPHHEELGQYNTLEAAKELAFVEIARRIRAELEWEERNLG